jgi:hypothetical protein
MNTKTSAKSNPTSRMPVETKARQVLAALSAENAWDFRTFSIDDLRSWLELVRGRKIHFFEVHHMPLGLFGVWMMAENQERDFVFFYEKVSPTHKLLIQLHELAHMILEHPTASVIMGEGINPVQNVEDKAFWAQALMRSTQSTRYDEEAEALARLILHEMKRHNPKLAPVSADENADGYARTMGID